MTVGTQVLIVMTETGAELTGLTGGTTIEETLVVAGALVAGALVAGLEVFA